MTDCTCKMNHDEINRTLGRLESKVDALLEEAKKTNGRVTKLETWKHQSTGKLTIIGAVAAFVVSLVGYSVNKMLWQ